MLGFWQKSTVGPSEVLHEQPVAMASVAAALKRLSSIRSTAKFFRRLWLDRRPIRFVRY
jgi:hypothetical protein